MIGTGIPAVYNSGNPEPVAAMKIFPPLSEILWPPGQSLKDVAWSRRYPLLIVICIFGGWTASTIIGDKGVATQTNSAFHSSAPAPTQVACTILSIDRTSDQITVRACAGKDLATGTTITTNAALPRSSMPPRSHQLTSADHAIAPPSVLRTSVFEENTAPIYAPEQPAIAWTPERK